MRFPAQLALLGSLALPAVAQEVSVFVSEGDLVPGTGRVVRIDSVSIADDRTSFVEVLSTDSAPGFPFRVLESGAVRFAEGQALSAPAGATLERIVGGVKAWDAGRSAGIFWHGPNPPLPFATGLYVDDTLTLLLGETTTAPGVNPASQYLGIIGVEFQSANLLKVVSILDDPALNSSNHYAIMVFEVDASGALVSERKVVKAGDPLPGQSQNVLRVGVFAPESAINRHGSVLFGAELFGDAFSNKVVYLDQTLLLQEGSPSPIPGRSWGENQYVWVDLNDAGDWVVNAELDASDPSNDAVIVRNGEVLAREGDAHPAIAPFSLTELGSEVWLTDSGDVIWSARWNAPDVSQNLGLFFNDQLVLQTGATDVAGETLANFYAGFERASLSPDGSRMLLIGSTYRSGGGERRAAFEIVFDVGSNYCPNAANSTGVPGTLRVEGSEVFADNDLTLLARGLPLGANGYFLASRAEGAVPSPPPFVGLLCLGGPIGRFSGPGQVQSSGLAGAFELGVDLTRMPTPTGFVSAAAGETWYFQAWHRDAFGASATSVFTDASAVTLR